MKWLNRPIDIASLVFFRITFGILAFSEMIGQLAYKHWYKGFYVPDEFHYHYIGFEWVTPFPEPLQSLFFISLLVSAVCITLGYRYRLFSILFAIGYTYTYLLEKGLYLNHGYLFCWLSFVMISLPAHHGWSIDNTRFSNHKWRTTPRWTVAILCFLMSCVYIFGGIAKINLDWLNGIPLTSWLAQKKDMFLIGGLLEKPAVPLFMSYSGLLIDLFAPLFLLWGRSRIYMLLVLIGFHLINFVLFLIGIFPWMSLCLSLMFFSPNWPRTLLRKGLALENWIGYSLRWIQARIYNEIPESALTPIAPKANLTKLSLVPLLLFILLQIGIPLRHNFFPGDVTWTEEGHRYSWRMMLRSKRGYGSFIVKSASQNKEKTIKPKEWLEKSMERKLYTHPDMIWQFAQYLKKHFEEAGWEDPEVYANIRAKVNGGPYELIVDNKTNLADVPYLLFSSNPWITQRPPIKSRDRKSN